MTTEMTDESNTINERCWKCGQEADLSPHKDLSGNGNVYNLCEECAEEMYESWDYEKGEPK